MGKQHWFGMNVQLGTFLSGVFTIFVTNMYVVFEEKHMGESNCVPENNLGKTLNNFIVCWSYKIILCLSVITIFISCFLLYSVYAQLYQGMVTYVVWIVFYEAVNSLLQALTNNGPPIEVRVLRWFGLISRIFMHGFWMFFVIRYAHIVYRNQMQSNVTYYSRRLSTIVESKGTESKLPIFPKTQLPISGSYKISQSFPREARFLDRRPLTLILTLFQFF